ALGAGRSRENAVLLGSVKTNIGHLQAAAGVAGLIKVVLALQHGEIPPHLHFHTPNPNIAWDELPVRVTVAGQPWPVQKTRRIAGVSSFGFTGTNSHVIVEAASHESAAPAPVVERPRHVLTLSGKSDAAVDQIAEAYQARLEWPDAPALADVCFTANAGRSHFSHRVAVSASTALELRDALKELARGETPPQAVRGKFEGALAPKVGWLFTGQGAQRAGMGRELYGSEPTFRAALERCAAILAPELETPLLDVLYGAASGRLDETAYTQPALFAVEYALAEVWRSWGVQPAVVLGHSVGEYVAACVAGVFSLEDGLKLVAARGRLMQALPQDGEMAVVLSDQARAAAAIQPYQQEISIAALNGPQNVVLSGRRQAVQAVRTALQAQGIQTQPLRVSHAFHSPLMEPMLASFARAAS